MPNVIDAILLADAASNEVCPSHEYRSFPPTYTFHINRRLVLVLALGKVTSHCIYRGATRQYCVKLSGENLSRYSIKTESVDLRKYP